MSMGVTLFYNGGRGRILWRQKIGMNGGILFLFEILIKYIDVGQWAYMPIQANMMDQNIGNILFLCH
jgi:hypothetical protein